MNISPLNPRASVTVPSAAPAEPKGKLDLPFLGLLLYTIIFYAQIAARIRALGPLRLEFIVGTVLVVAAIYRFSTGAFDFRETRMNTSAVLLIVFCLLITPFAMWPTLSLETWVRLLKFFAIYLMIVTTVDTQRKFTLFIVTYLAMNILLFVEPFILSLQGKGYIYNNYMMRLAGVTPYFGHPNNLAGMTSANLPFLYYLFLHARSKTLKIVWLALMVVAVRVIMLTQSRTGFVGVIAFAFFILVFSRRKLAMTALLVVALMFAWAFAPPETKERFMTFKDMDEVISGEIDESEAGSMAGRWRLMKHAFIIFTEHPVLGVGLDNFVVASQRKWQRWIPPHNTYLQALAEMGIVGFSIFVSVLVITFKNLNASLGILAANGQESGFLYHMTMALKVYLLVRLVVSFFGIELYDNYWWLVGGLSVVTLRIARGQAKEIPAAASPSRVAPEAAG